jgi:hypothetical protein
MVNQQISSLALEASHVLRGAPGRLFFLSGYNAKAAAQFIQLHDRAAVPSDLVVGVAEVSTVDTTGLTAAGLADKYFLLSGASGGFYVWFNLDAGGVDPAVANRTAVPVAIATGNTVAQIATAIAAALDALADFDAAAVVNVVTITDAATGARTDIAAGNSGLAVGVSTQGVTAIAAAVPLATYTVPASSNFEIPLHSSGLEFFNGIVVCNSSTSATKTAGGADCFFTALVQ